ncbi:MAG: class I SAM-dependent methyltransferase [Sulfobacillus sp.]
MRKDLLAQARGDVLEVGCGTGRNLPFYVRATTLTLTEPDPEMARRTRRRLSMVSVPVQLVEAPAEALPFADCRFECVVSTLVLCTVKDPVAALAEIRRVLVPGGRLLILEHVQAHPGIWRVAQNLLAPAWKSLAAGCHLSRPSLALIETAGFVPVVVREVGQGLLPLRIGRYRAPN